MTKGWHVGLVLALSMTSLVSCGLTPQPTPPGCCDSATDTNAQDTATDMVSDGSPDLPFDYTSDTAADAVFDPPPDTSWSDTQPDATDESDMTAGDVPDDGITGDAQDEDVLEDGDGETPDADAVEPGPCVALDPDAYGSCEMILGAVWDGSECVWASGCSCDTDCAHFFPALEDCIDACL